MHIYFSGIGGSGIGPLALIAKQTGYMVSGSDKQDSRYIAYLRENGIDAIHIGQSYEDIAAVHREIPIDWYVYSSAVSIEQPDAPEFSFCQNHNIRMSKRDEFINTIVSDQNLSLLAIAGTHGKTTTTAMTVWACQQLGIPIGYILPAKSSFASMGEYQHGARYFVYECDEFDRNFLHFHPELSLITGIGWDHPDIYPTKDSYNDAFIQFIDQSQSCILWLSDAKRLNISQDSVENVTLLNDQSEEIHAISLPGNVNRRDAWLVANGLSQLGIADFRTIISTLESFPGVSRRFEQVTSNIRLYTDYAHTAEKISGALQLGQELAGKNLVVVYEGLHNTRQHFMRDDLAHLFDAVKMLYVTPSYLAREDPDLELLTPEKLISAMSCESQTHAQPAILNQELKDDIQKHLAAGDTVLCLSAGGGGSLDEWLRGNFAGKTELTTSIGSDD